MGFNYLNWYSFFVVEREIYSLNHPTKINWYFSLIKSNCNKNSVISKNKKLLIFHNQMVNKLYIVRNPNCILIIKKIWSIVGNNNCLRLINIFFIYRNWSKFNFSNSKLKSCKFLFENFKRSQFQTSIY